MKARFPESPGRVRARRVALAAPLVLALAGCSAHLDRTMTSWEGRTAADLIAAWGSPQKTYPDGSGGQVLVWTATQSYPAAPPGKAAAPRRSAPPASASNPFDARAELSAVRGYRMFWAGADGVLYKWDWKGW